MPYHYGGNASETFYSGSIVTNWEPGFVFASGGNDTIYGGTGSDYLYGEAGNDYISDVSGNGGLYGGAGNDTIVSGTPSRATLDGGDGDDIFYFTHSRAPGDGNFGFHDIIGGSGQDTVRAGVSNTDIGLTSITGVEVIDGSGVTGVTIEANPDGARLDFTNVTLINISAINGLSGADSIVGSAGNDSIYGGATGADTLIGGAGDDTIQAGTGSSILTGGDGADLFVMSNHGSRIADFDGLEGDRIAIRTGASWTLTDVATGTYLEVTSGAYIYGVTVLGVSAVDVQSDWIIT